GRGGARERHRPAPRLRAGRPLPPRRLAPPLSASGGGQGGGITGQATGATMKLFLHGLARAAGGAFSPPGPGLEVGAYQVGGQEPIAELRGLFPGKEYVGVDVRPGPGVDLVEDVQALTLPDASVGTVLALSTFEHVPHFWRGLEEVRRVLKPGGALLMACPFYFHIHDYPSDYC